jgi:hypothetical protein
MRENRTMQVSFYCLLVRISIVIGDPIVTVGGFVIGDPIVTVGGFVIGDPIVTVGGIGIPLTRLNQSHFCVCPKLGHEFSTA